VAADAVVGEEGKDARTKREKNLRDEYVADMKAWRVAFAACLRLRNCPVRRGTIHY
jgi:hypothetical protein